MTPSLAWRAVVLGVMCSALAPVRAQDRDPGPTPPVPVYHEPHHRQVFQHGPMRILDLQLPPGDISWFHSHESPVLYLSLSQGQMRTQNLGEAWSGGRAGGARSGAPGAAGRGAVPARGGRTASDASPAGPRPTSTTGYAERPVVHRLENIGTTLIRAIVVINESAGDDAAGVEAAGFTSTPELTNRWFRAYRISLAPGEKTASHRHHAPVAIVQTTGGTGEGAGAVTFELNEPGQWAFFDADAAHEVRNTGSSRMDLIEVEVRRK